MENSDSESQCEFTLNGQKHVVGCDVPLEMSLNMYLREVLNLRGTKYMCLEGGCGACLVSLTIKDPATSKNRTLAVNSCLLSVYSCAGKSVTTIEGLGSTKRGYSVEQRTLADQNGTQCGYCSPGMVMNMHSLMAEKKVTMKEIENSFGGNMCRCTGYRPIMTAFKSLASDATPKLNSKCSAIEVCCDATCRQKGSWEAEDEKTLQITVDGATWYKPKSVSNIFKILSTMPDGPYMLVGGNTGQGVFRRTVNPKTYIDISNVEELHRTVVSSEVKLGANITLTDAMNYFKTVSKEQSSEFGYLEEVAKHIDLIASVPVRNTGTIAGNLILKHQNREFPSDVFLILETVGAKLEIGSSRSSMVTVSPLDFLDVDLKSKILVRVKLPSLDTNYVVRSYKIMPRAQNAHAYVNAGFCFKLNLKNKGQVLERPRIVYGGINPSFIHAVRTEEYLEGKQLFNANVLKAALRTLEGEINPDHVLPDASPEYRKGLAVSLFYKFVLNLAPQGLKKGFSSGGQMLTRDLSHGQQKYQTDSLEWPLNKPVIKLEAHVQTSGEAIYIDDMPTIHGELFGSLVLAKEGPGTIEKIDASEALAMSGVAAFFSADDIPGKNDFTKFTPQLLNLPETQELFCSGKVMYAGQPVGIIVATSKPIASAAAALVTVKIKDRKKPILTIEEAIASRDSSRVRQEVIPTSQKNSSGGILDSVTSWWSSAEEGTRVLKGKFSMNSQYHFHIETQTCVCVPQEGGMDVYTASQWIDLVNSALAQCLDLPENYFNIQVRRIGGAYGGKITGSSQVACACALAAHKLNRPVRLILTLEQNTESMGKRCPVGFEYEVKCMDDGKITSLNAQLYQNSGCSWNDTPMPYFTVGAVESGYSHSTWRVSGTAVKTDQCSYTYTRAPGSFEGIVDIEMIMEHIAHELNLDPIKVRLANMDPAETNLPVLVQQICTSSNYDQRKKDVEKFNKGNRWKKRGLAFSCMKLPIAYSGGFNAMVTIYHFDGSVSVAHSGSECGQGINTKIAQVAAKILGIDLEKVTVKPTNNFTAPNGAVTGGSITSESCAYATMMCCQELLKRLEPVKKTMTNPTWMELVRQAYSSEINLCANYMTKTADIQIYSVEGAAVAEVEMDVLTGQFVVLRVDIVENAGKSLSPELDIGQVEGAFIMGMGCLTSEEVVYNPETGRLLTNCTWNYKPPGVRDIPVEFNVELQGNHPNPGGVLRSKATGEPAVCLSSSVFFAIKNALLEARKDAGLSEKYFEMNAPATCEKIFLASKTNIEQFTL